MPTVDLATTPLRELNAALHRTKAGGDTSWQVLNPRGQHSVATGVDAPVTVEIDGSVGYYCAGMNKQASVVDQRECRAGRRREHDVGRGSRVAETHREPAGATGCGGLLVIDGNASARCGISMKGIDIVVKGSVGHISAFMAQAGNLVVLGDAGEALGDSIYEADLFVRRHRQAALARIASRSRWPDEHKAVLLKLLNAAGVGNEVDVNSVPPLRLGAQALPLPHR